MQNNGDDYISDLHIESIDPDIFATVISVTSHHPKPPDHYKKRLPRSFGIVHATVEVCARHCHH